MRITLAIWENRSMQKQESTNWEQISTEKECKSYPDGFFLFMEPAWSLSLNLTRSS